MDDDRRVAVVALVAASVSYRHALDVVGQHGETGWLDKVYPLTVDGLIYLASMVLLNDARRGLTPHWLAYDALGLGISATLAVTVAAGLAHGVVSANRRGVASAGPGDLLRTADADLPPVGRACTRRGYTRSRSAGASSRAERSRRARDGTFADDLAAATVPAERDE